MSATIYELAGHDPVHVDDRPLVTSPDAAADVLRSRTAIHDAEVEECWMLVLDTRHRLMCVEMVSRGSIDHTFMSPREVFRLALRHNAAAIVLAHNHPSGDPTPSRDDEGVTRRLSKSAEMLGVDLLDHLVIGGQFWVSMARRGQV